MKHRRRWWINDEDKASYVLGIKTNLHLVQVRRSSYVHPDKLKYFEVIVPLDRPYTAMAPPVTIVAQVYQAFKDQIEYINEVELSRLEEGPPTTSIIWFELQTIQSPDEDESANPMASLFSLQSVKDYLDTADGIYKGASRDLQAMKKQIAALRLQYSQEDIS